MLLTDYHTHTPLCLHAEGWPIDCARAAAERGLAEIGISDHSPMDGPEPFDDWRMRRADLPRYFDAVAEARATSPIPVRLGLECDFIIGHEAWLDELAGLADWDYLIGSTHYIAPGFDVDSPRHVNRYTRTPHATEEIWEAYWQAFRAMAASGRFDFLAHPDLPKKFGHRPPGDLRRFYEPAIEAIVRGGSALEVSTAGLHKPVGELYPGDEFLRLACAAGVPVLINSDAHHPDEVGRDFDRALAAVHAAGYREVCRFERRQRRMVRLEEKEEG